MTRKHLYLHCLLVVGGLVSKQAGAVTIVLSDFDNTIVEARQKLGGTFKTPYRLFLIEQRANTLQAVPEGPKEIRVSPIDFDRIRKYLGEGNRFPGAFKKVTLEDGQVMIPGNYMVRNPDTFIRFRTAQEKGQNYLLEDFIYAEKREPQGAWQGPLWEMFVSLMEDPQMAAAFRITSARGHSQQDWDELFGYWKKQGYISHLPNTAKFHNVSLPEYEQFGLGADIPNQKVAILKELAMRLGRVPLAVGQERLHPNGKDRGRYHYVIFADDNQETIELAVKECQALVQSRMVPVKFGIFNMGYRTEIINSGRPQYAIIEPGGTFRQATEAEKVGEPIVILPEAEPVTVAVLETACSDALASEGNKSAGKE